MSYPIKYPTPQGANIQIFNGGNANTAAHDKGRTWVKPQGASFVWFTLIGAGGGTDVSAVNLVGGGSGAVTNFMGPAFLIPDVLQVVVGKGTINTGEGSRIYYQQKDSAGYDLMTADGGFYGTSGGNGGASMNSNYFTAMGFFQSVVGQAGVNSIQSASTTTFLSGGSYNNVLTANYGYYNEGNGYFQTQPIIVGTGGSVTGNGRGGIGCGGGGSSSTGIGGDGMVVIITW